MTVNAITKRCIRDSIRMVQKDTGGIMFWVCPTCGWEDPAM